MIRVTDKFIGKTDHPNYIHCDNIQDFMHYIIHDSLDLTVYKTKISDMLKTKGVISSDETSDVFFGGHYAVSTIGEWNETDQTTTREMTFASQEDYNNFVGIQQQVDYDSILDNIMFTYEVVSVEEI